MMYLHVTEDSNTDGEQKIELLLLTSSAKNVRFFVQTKRN